MSNNIKVLLIGTGNMANEYYKVLKACEIETIVVGRGEERARVFKKNNNCKKVYWGGLENCPQEELKDVSHAIIAVNVPQLCEVTKQVIGARISNILVEKPGALSKDELSSINVMAKEKGVNIFIAYNRRFYSSVLKAQEIINNDGGVSSFNFEFTEWGHVIEKTNNDEITKNNWLLANSTHVIDLAFYLGGKPVQMNSYIGGRLSWHENGSNYVGAGKTDKGALFSYCANWDAPGRWSVEILTKNFRLYLKPMEQLQIQQRGTVKIDQVEIDDELDTCYKPGLYRELQAFLINLEKVGLMTLEEQISEFDIYMQIAGKN
ncbi:Predicted dehydrogenase [Pseudobutyrivibrio sp. AR14]|uniref:Gfo/Idh/MocA family protein n=1 Tax=Pseudobutyrivibrio sp. AR14 TaxID=1520804 RepID=UPI00088ADCC7|nr:Gfo/Idh/MocA family oxidoreductase [Pseudobutyrivibrio sp. AR14]SCY45035.1 Predicted dehydrogenase [Pseudobutyrivibrio sp. AR14]